MKRLETLDLNRIVLLAFAVIAGMVLLLGAVSFYGILSLNQANNQNEGSYKTMMYVQDIQHTMENTDAEIFSYFSGNGWKSHSVDTSPRSSFAIENEEIKADIRSIGTQPWSVQLFHGPFVLKKGHKYSISFEARTTIPRFIEVILENSVNYKGYMAKRINLNTEMTAYSYEFEMESDTDMLTRLSFSLGKFSLMTPRDHHQVYLDNVSVIDLNTGKQLIRNGQFEELDTVGMLTDAADRIEGLLGSIGQLTADHEEQQQLHQKLSDLFAEWLHSNEVLIRSLRGELAASGNIAVDIDLQSREANLSLSAEIQSIAEQIKTIEEAKLAGRKKQSTAYKYLVYSGLFVTLLLCMIVFLIIYRYFNRSIIGPISWTSAILRELVDDDDSASKELKDLSLPMDSASAEIRRLHHHIMAYIKLLQNEIHIDGLTGLANRRSFNTMIEEWVQQQLRFSLVLFDIDHFKRINDTFGHLIGDEVIKSFASVMRREAGQQHICFRYGGEEFGLLMIDQDIHSARETAERIRAAFEKTEQPNELTVTVSAGAAQYREGERAEAVIQRADEALYRSKSEGRNRTTSACEISKT